MLTDRGMQDKWRRAERMAALTARVAQKRTTTDIGNGKSLNPLDEDDLPPRRRRYSSQEEAMDNQDSRVKPGRTRANRGSAAERNRRECMKLMKTAETQRAQGSPQASPKAARGRASPTQAVERFEA